MRRTLGQVFGKGALTRRVSMWGAGVWCAGLAAALTSGAARADYPRPWQMNLQEPATPVADFLYKFHDYLLLPIITLITLFVLGLLLTCIVRFRASVHPVPTRRTHNTVLEIAWTVIPILILVVIAIPSFKLLYFQEIIPKSEFTLKVTGLQWYWHYDYPDQGNFGFDSDLLDPSKLQPGQERLLEVDNEVVLPEKTNVRVIIAGHDVMHSWFIPSLGVQKYAVPGHLNEVWINADHTGTFYGECNQICGVNHSFMPIKVHIVTKEEFATWLAQAKVKFAQNDSAAPTRVAAAELTPRL
jgi:cytochrome c oxidase subunit 2